MFQAGKLDNVANVSEKIREARLRWLLGRVKRMIKEDAVMM